MGQQDNHGHWLESSHGIRLKDDSKGALIWMRAKGVPVVKDGKGTGSLVESTSPINSNDHETMTRRENILILTHGDRPCLF